MKSVVMAIAIGGVWLAMATGSNSRSWTLDGTFAEVNGGCPFAPAREIAPSFVQEDGRKALRLKGDMLTANGEAIDMSYDSSLSELTMEYQGEKVMFTKA